MWKHIHQFIRWSPAALPLYISLLAVATQAPNRAARSWSETQFEYFQFIEMYWYWALAVFLIVMTIWTGVFVYSDRKANRDPTIPYQAEIAKLELKIAIDRDNYDAESKSLQAYIRSINDKFKLSIQECKSISTIILEGLTLIAELDKQDVTLIGPSINDKIKHFISLVSATCSSRFSDEGMYLPYFIERTPGYDRLSQEAKDRLEFSGRKALVKHAIGNLFRYQYSIPDCLDYVGWMPPAVHR